MNENADVIQCGLCSSEFLLSDYHHFLEHKISRCDSFNGNKLSHFKNYLCLHCTFTSKSAVEFLKHIEEYHHLRMTRLSNCDQEVQVQDYDEINLQHLLSFPPTANANSSTDASERNYTQTKSFASSEGVKKRERCCLEDPNSGYCDEMTACPLLMDGQLITENQTADEYTEETVGTVQHSTEDNSSNSDDNDDDDCILLLPSAVSSTTNPKNSHSQESISISKVVPVTKLHVCPHCQRSFKQKVHMKKHVLVKHQNLRPHKCSLCAYQTVDKAYLKTHMRKHTGERPYSCSVCSYRSAQNCALKVHMRRVHPGFTSPCRHCCGQSFVTQLEVERHEQHCTHRSVTLITHPTFISHTLSH